MTKMLYHQTRKMTEIMKKTPKTKKTFENEDDVKKEKKLEWRGPKEGGQKRKTNKKNEDYHKN